MSRELRILATSFDFRPRLGGVATCAYEVCKALASIDGVRLRLLSPDMPGATEFDRHGLFETYRAKLPASALQAVPIGAGVLAKQMLEFKPHANLHFLWMPGGVASLTLSPLRASLGVPYFVMAHGVELMESNRNLRKRIRGLFSPVKQAVFEGAAASFAVSRFTGDLLLSECGLDPSRIVVSYNGVDPSEFTPGPRSIDLEQRFDLKGRKVFLTVTRLEPYKGVDRAIGALSLIAKKHPEAALLVCGEGSDRARLEALARERGVSDQVRFAGAVPAGRLIDFYRLADCFMLLSRLDRLAPNVEGFGLVFLEAAACCKPSIGGRSGGIGDAVEEGRSGWLVDPEDEPAIARAMTRVLEHPDEAARVGEQGRARALESFTWQHVASRIHERISSEVSGYGRA